MTLGDDWTEKYRPRSLDGIVGNPGAARQMREWAESWDAGIPEKRALVLIGTPGIGKTSSAEALARDMGWGIVEMNASDQRTGDAIRNVALRASHYDTFGSDGKFKSASKGERKLVVLDEADSLFGNADRGAMPVINELIRTAKQPVVLIVNDFYALSRKSAAIKTDTLQIKFRKPQATSVENVLRMICSEEGIAYDQGVLSKIAENADGDLRAAVRDLQAAATGTACITMDDTSFMNGRESRSDMYDLMNAVFRKRDPAAAKKILRQCDTDPGTVSLWLDENMPYECASAGDLVRGYERLSKADIYLGRVSKRQYYGMWSYANDMMIDGIIEAIHGKSISHDRIRFPMYLSKMSRSKYVRATRGALASKIGAMIHTPSNTFLRDTLPYIRTIATSDPEFRVMLVKEAGLEPEELGFLIGKKIDSREVKKAFEDADPRSAEKESKKTVRKKMPPEPKADVPAPEISEPAKPDPPKDVPAIAPAADDAAARQRSLFDF